MAIRSVYTTNEPAEGHPIGPDGKRRNALGQPPQFRATGKGLNVAYPEAPANKATANAWLEAKFTDSEGAMDTRPWLKKIYLYIDSFQTGWTVAGEYGQTKKSRTWYPRNLSQDDFVITGQCVNQFEFDKLVEFVEYHQKHIVTALDKTIDPPSEAMFEPVQVEAVEFFMGLKKTEHMSPEARAAMRAHYKYRFTPYMHMTMAIMNIQAGHERFQFAPAFTITMKILDDHYQKDSEVEYEIKEMVYSDDNSIIFTNGDVVAVNGQGSLNDPIANAGQPDRGGGVKSQ